MTDGTKLSALKTKFDTLGERAKKADELLQGLIPLTGRSPEAQQAFLLTLADLKLLEQLLQTAQETFNGFIGVQQLSPDQESGDFVAALVEAAKDLIEMLVEQLGVSQDVVMPAVIQDLDRQILMIETIIIRAESTLRDARDYGLGEPIRPR